MNSAPTPPLPPVIPLPTGNAPAPVAAAPDTFEHNSETYEHGGRSRDLLSQDQRDQLTAVASQELSRGRLTNGAVNRLFGKDDPTRAELLAAKGQDRLAIWRQVQARANLALADDGLAGRDLQKWDAANVKSHVADYVDANLSTAASRRVAEELPGLEREADRRLAGILDPKKPELAALAAGSRVKLLEGLVSIAQATAEVEEAARLAEVRSAAIKAIGGSATADGVRKLAEHETKQDAAIQNAQEAELAALERERRAVDETPYLDVRAKFVQAREGVANLRSAALSTRHENNTIQQIFEASEERDALSQQLQEDIAQRKAGLYRKYNSTDPAVMNEGDRQWLDKLDADQAMLIVGSSDAEREEYNRVWDEYIQTINARHGKALFASTSRPTPRPKAAATSTTPPVKTSRIRRLTSAFPRLGRKGIGNTVAQQDPSTLVTGPVDPNDPNVTGGGPVAGGNTSTGTPSTGDSGRSVRRSSGSRR